VTDAVAALVAAGVKEGTDGEVFNIGTDVETTIEELGRQIITLTGARSDLRLVEQASVYGESYEDIPRRVPDVTKMREILGVRAETPLDEGLRYTIEWFRQQGDWGRPSGPS
jgi:nucleoside-diphosphate-sugar epimerase